MEQTTIQQMQQRFAATGNAIDVSDFKELCFRITEIFISNSSEASGNTQLPCPYEDCKELKDNVYGLCSKCGRFPVKAVLNAAKPRLSTAEIKRKLPIRFSYDEVTLALTELVRIRALDEHVIKGKLFYSRR